MLNAIRSAAVGLALLAGSSSLVQAQYPGRGYNNPARQPQAPAVDRAMEDLRNVAARNTYSGRDRDRYEHAMQHLSEFAGKLYSGRFDRGKLDRSIDDLRHVLQHNRMEPRAREVLSYDLNELYRMRSSSGYAYRY